MALQAETAHRGEPQHRAEVPVRPLPEGLQDVLCAGQAPDGAQRHAHSPVRAVRQDLSPHQQPLLAPGDARHHARLPVHRLRQALQDGRLPEGAPEDAQRRRGRGRAGGGGPPVPDLRKGLQAAAPPAQSPASAHRGAPPPVSGGRLSDVLQAARGGAPAPAGAHRGAPFCLQPLSGRLQNRRRPPPPRTDRAHRPAASPLSGGVLREGLQDEGGPRPAPGRPQGRPASSL